MDSEHRRNPRPFNLMTTRGRPAFSRCGLLPAPREPLRLRSGEQNLHTIPAPALETRRLFPGAVCSPLPANPCGSVPGSKIFTQFPRRHSRPAGFSEARFAPRSLQTLAAPFRGAKSSHNSRAAPEAGRLFRGAICSPLPANPCGSVPGSKIFTQFPRRHSGPAGFFKARFAPRSPQTLAALFRGAKSSHNSRAAARGRPAFSRRGLLPAPCEPLWLRSGEQNLHTIPAALSRAARAAHPKIPEAHSASGIFPLLLSSSIYPFPVAGIPDSENSPLPGGLPCRKAGIPQSSSG